MKKFITPIYTFTPGTSGFGLVNLLGIDNFDVRNLVSIINQTRGVVIYATGSRPLRYTSLTDTTVTLFADTSSMSAGDTLQVIYEDNSALVVEPVIVDAQGNEVTPLATSFGGTAIGNTIHKFNDKFAESGPDLSVWDEQWINKGLSTVTKGGETQGSSYLKISMSPVDLSEYVLTSKQTFNLPTVAGFAISASQRVIGQEFQIGIVGCDDEGNIEYLAQPPVALPGTTTVLSNFATINFSTPHPFKGGDRVIIYGNTNNLLNFGPVIVTVVTNLQIFVPLSLNNGTYNLNGFIGFADLIGFAKNGSTLSLGDSNSGNASTFGSRCNGARFKSTTANINTTIATSSGTSNFTENFIATNLLEFTVTPEDTVFTNRNSDSSTQASMPIRFTQAVPDETKKYKLFIKAKNYERNPRVIGLIVSAVKTGSSTVTITLDRPHGIDANGRVTVTGIIDRTNFPNVTAATTVSSIVSPTQFTIVMGSGTTATSSGGFVTSCENGFVMTGIANNFVINMQRSNNIMQIIFVNAAAISQGETMYLGGTTIASLGLYDGLYLVRRVSGSTVFLQSVGPDFAQTASGGNFAKVTDFRVHNVRLKDYLQTTVNIATYGGSDQYRELPVRGFMTVTGTPIVTTSASSVTQVSSMPSVTINSMPAVTIDGNISGISSTVYTAEEALRVFNNEVYSDSLGPGTYYSGSYQVLSSGFSEYFLEVYSSSGSNKILVTIEEDRTGLANEWRPVLTVDASSQGSIYFPTIVAKSVGYRIKIVVPVGSTFVFGVFETRSFVALTDSVQQLLINGDINTSVINSTGPIFSCGDVKDFTMSVMTASQTTAATLTLEFSNNQVDWYTPPAGTVTTSTTSVVVAKYLNESWSHFRVRVTAAGTAVVIKQINVRGVK